MQLFQSLGFGWLKAALDSLPLIVPVVLFFIVIGHRRFLKLKEDRLNYAKDKIEFMSGYFSKEEYLQNKTYRDFVYNYFYDTTCLSSHKIDYFEKCPNPGEALKDYTLCWDYFDFSFDDEHPSLKPKIKDKGIIKLERKNMRDYWVAIFFSVLPCYILLTIANQHFVKLLSVSIALTILSLLFLLFAMYDLRKISAAKRLLKQIEERKSTLIEPCV